MADADAIHELAEILFKAAAEGDPTYLAAFNHQLDLATNVVHGNVMVAASRLPERLRLRVDESVERNVIAFLDDLQILCKVANVPRWGRVYHLTMPGKLVRPSWDKISQQLRDRPSGGGGRPPKEGGNAEGP